MHRIILKVIICLIAANVLLMIWGGDSKHRFVIGLNILAVTAGFAIEWWNTFVVTVRQFNLNKSILVLLHGLDSSGGLSVSSDSSRKLANAENMLRSKTWLIARFIHPWKHLKNDVALARELLAQFELRRRTLNPTQKTSLDNIDKTEINLLSSRFRGRGCPHEYDMRFDKEENPFVCLKSGIQDNVMWQVWWCKYCLVSFRSQKHIPVIVKPP